MKQIACPKPVRPAVVMLAGSLLLTGCEEPPAPSARTEPVAAPASATLSPEQQALATALATVGEQQLRKLGAQATGFSDAVDGLLTAPDPERLATAQLAWQHLYRSYNVARTLLSCRALADPLQAQRLERTDPLPILPGYIDSLEAWPGSGLVNDVTVPLDREALLEQQGATSDAEASVGFQVLQFLLFGEPGHPRQASAFTVPPDSPEDEASATENAEETAAAKDTGAQLDLMPLEDQPQRRRKFLRLVAGLLVDDLRLLARQEQDWGTPGPDCPVRAMADTTRRLIQLENLNEHDEVSGEYLAAQSREIAAQHLWQGLVLWLGDGGPLQQWAASTDPLAAEQLQALGAPPTPDLALLQRLHAALTTLGNGH